MDLKDLAKPFRADEINWKPQTISGDKKRALAVAYIDARDVAERLDEVVGPESWQVDHKQVGDQTLTGIGIRNAESGEWAWKWDIGIVDREGEEAMSAKGSLSDGLKRAGVLWGIGRYLYRLPKVWVDYDDQKRRLVTTPELPKWALPEGAKPQKPAAADDKKPEPVKTPDAKAHYRQLLGRAKLTHEEGVAILNDCKGDLELAIDKLETQYIDAQKERGD